MITVASTKGSNTNVHTTEDLAHARVLAVYAIAMGAERCTVTYDGIEYDAADFEKLCESALTPQV